MEEIPKIDTTKKLQEELAIRGKYYFKGFGTCLQGILADLGFCVKFERTPEIAEHARNILNTITKAYQSIPFEQITNHPDYELLKQINEAILKLVPEAEAVLGGKNDIKESWELIKLIAEKGREYQAGLITLMKKINKQPGHEKDGFPVVDLNGKTWKYPF